MGTDLGATQFEDIQEAASALPTMDFEFRQLEAGPLRVAVDVKGIDDLRLTRVRLDRLVQGNGLVDPDRIVFLICEEAQQPHIVDDTPLQAGQVLLTEGGIPSDCILQPGFSATLLSCSADSVRQILQVHGTPLPNLSTPASAAWRQLSSLLAEAGREGSRHDHSLSDRLLQSLCDGLEVSRGREPGPLAERVRMARATRDLLERDDELRIVEICRQLAVSERTLRRVFAEIYGTSPIQYQLARRLNLVRKSLKESACEPGAISTIAAQNGFWHMGRFGLQYRRQFGETPRQTLGKTRGFHGL